MAMLGDSDDYWTSHLCSCGHLRTVHRRTGGCEAGNCICGWEIRDGFRYEKSTGLMVKEGRDRIAARHLSQKLIRLRKRACFYCGRSAESLDHFVAQSRGGRTVQKNLVPACHRCNNLKGSMSYEDFVAHCERFMWQEYERQKAGKIGRVIQFPICKVPA